MDKVVYIYNFALGPYYNTVYYILWSYSNEVLNVWTSCRISHHYIYDIILIKLDKQKWASTLETLEGHMRTREWEISLTQIQEPAVSIDYLGVQWSGACLVMPPKLKKTIIISPTSHIKNGNTTSSVLGGSMCYIWDQGIRKAAIFE